MFEKLLLVKEMIRQLVFSLFIKMKAVNLSEQQALDAEHESIQQFNFNGDLGQQASIFFITEVPR